MCLRESAETSANVGGLWNQLILHRLWPEFTFCGTNQLTPICGIMVCMQLLFLSRQVLVPQMDYFLNLLDFSSHIHLVDFVEIKWYKLRKVIGPSVCHIEKSDLLLPVQGLLFGVGRTLVVHHPNTASWDVLQCVTKLAKESHAFSAVLWSSFNEKKRPVVQCPC